MLKEILETLGKVDSNPLRDIVHKNLDNQMSADSTGSDEDWVRIYKYFKGGDYETAKNSLPKFIGANNSYKIDFNQDERTIRLSLPEAKSEIVFEIFDGEELLFTARGDSGADQVERKLKTKKFQKIDARIMRSIDGEYEDITKLFIK